MIPTGQERHCATCQQTVVDFTQKTDAEILAHFQQVAHKTCGRFRSDQLGRCLQPAAASRQRAWLSALLAVGSLGQLLAPKAAAQTAVCGTAGPLPMAIAPAQAPASPTGTTPASQPTSELAATLRLAGSHTISGTVRDAARHDPLPGVTVLLKGTTLSTSTDQDGTFILPVPGDAPVVQLEFHYVGYTLVEQTVAIADNASLAVMLPASVMGEVIVTSATQPSPWHPRRLYFWRKAKLARTLGK